MLFISKADTIAVDNIDTDLPLFDACKTSVELGNSSEFVKSKAIVTVDGYLGDDVIDALNLPTLKLFEV